MIAVGLVPKLYDLDHQPGWLQHSVAFHADDGKYVTSTADYVHSAVHTDAVDIQ